jgi:hypothetical protein
MGNQFCASMGKKFELVTESTTSNIPGVRFGGASIIFKRAAGHARMRRQTQTIGSSSQCRE